MNQYVTGTVIKELREKKGLTQAELAKALDVSDKAISKWETGRGYPDITLLEPIATALGISTLELLSGQNIINSNQSFNILKSKLYVCPACGNVIYSTGEAVMSCCGIRLLPLEAEEPDDEHRIQLERIEDEYYVTVKHDMSKGHYISFFASLSDQGINIVKLYPEGSAEARFNASRVRYIYYYCNKHGLFKVKVNKNTLTNKL